MLCHIVIMIEQGTCYYTSESQYLASLKGCMEAHTTVAGKLKWLTMLVKLPDK